VPKLKPGESRTFAIDFAILAGREPIEREAAKIAALQAGRQTQVNSQPIKPE
jgi:hypothetical protein